MGTTTKEQLIEELKASAQNASGMFEISEDTICALMTMLQGESRMWEPAPVSVPECFKRLLHHAYGMTMGHDWNKGAMAGHHRTKLCQAVEECRAAMLQDAPPTPVVPDEWTHDQCKEFCYRLDVTVGHGAVYAVHNAIKTYRDAMLQGVGYR